MKVLAGLVRLFEGSSASDSTICEAYTDSSRLQLKANDLGRCAIYEKELQRVWAITEQNRQTKIAEFAEKHGFRLSYYKQEPCAIFLENSTRHNTGACENRRDARASQ